MSAAVDPFRQLAIAGAVLCAAGDHAQPRHFEALRDRLEAARTLSEDMMDLRLSQRLLRDAAAAVPALGWRLPPVRDLLWAAVRLYGQTSAARADAGQPEANPRYWWRED